MPKRRWLASKCEAHRNLCLAGITEHVASTIQEERSCRWLELLAYWINAVPIGSNWMPNQYQTYMRGPIDTRRARTRLTAEMRQRILDCFPVRIASPIRERSLLNRIGRWIERYTLAIERARSFPPAEEQKESIERIMSTGQDFFTALLNADRETKRLIYAFLAARHGDVIGGFEGDDFTRGRLRYQQLLFLTSLVRSGAKRSKKLVGAGPRGKPLGDFVRVMKEIWIEATGLPFVTTAKLRHPPRKADRPRLFVETVLSISEELACEVGRELWPMKPEKRAGAIVYAMRNAEKLKSPIGAGRTREEEDADRNTYRVR